MENMRLRNKLEIGTCENPVLSLNHKVERKSFLHGKTDTEGNHTERFEKVDVVLETGGKNSIICKKS